MKQQSVSRAEVSPDEKLQSNDTKFAIPKSRASCHSGFQHGRTIRFNHDCCYCDAPIYIEQNMGKDDDGFWHTACKIDLIKQQTALALKQGFLTDLQCYYSNCCDAKVSSMLHRDIEKVRAEIQKLEKGK